MGDTSLPPLKKKREDDEEGGAIPREKWTPHNWQHFRKTDKDLKKMPPVLKSRYLAYEDPPKEAADAQAMTAKRLVEKKRENIRTQNPKAEDELDEQKNHEKLIGQLKAAEARNRIRIMRLRYEANRGQEINHLIACQPTARKAVRMQALLPVKPEDRSQGDTIDKISRARVEALLDDTRGILIGRT